MGGGAMPSGVIKGGDIYNETTLIWVQMPLNFLSISPSSADQEVPKTGDGG